MRLDCVKRVRETIFVRDSHLEQKGREAHCLEELKWDLKRGRFAVAAALTSPGIRSRLWTHAVVITRYRTVEPLFCLEGAGPNEAASLSRRRSPRLLIITCDWTLNVLTRLKPAGSGRAAKPRLICCRERNKFCCLFKQFQTRLTKSVQRDEVSVFVLVM